MAKGAYIGVNGVARKVTTPYIGVSGVAREVTAGYVGVNGVARLFFAPDNGVPVVLEVEKVTSDTYVGSSTYTGEKFILLDIYPKTNGKVKVTYGGLTKTITDTSGAEEPNAQQVSFGSFGGTSDTTPDSGTVTISGDYRGVGIGSFKKEKSGTDIYCDCVYDIKDLGDVVYIPDRAFYRGAYGVLDTLPTTRRVVIPPNVTYIGTFAFGYQYQDGNAMVAKCYLEELVMLPTTPPVLKSALLPYFDTFTVVVPKGCGEAYRTAEEWSDYDSAYLNTDYIVEAL